MRSAAERAGIRAGDILLALNDMPVRDIIDVQIYASEPELRFLVERHGQHLTLDTERRYGEPLGLSFAADIFDGKIRACRNHCDFCFVSQMAPGMRPSLYVKDDDYRLSFLHGNYITLTNLNEADWERIEAQFLSPLYVSVHATAPEVREDLMHHPHAGDILTQLTRLAEIGIEVHTQAVLVPGRNDGAQLDHTLTDLVSLYPAVADLTVVPVGLTRWHHPELRPYTSDEATAVLTQTLAWQTRLRDELGLGFVYPSDEWFLRAGMPVPPLAQYDGLLPALIENGVGMVRTFLEGWPTLHKALASLEGARQIWATGTLFAPVLQAHAQAFIADTGLDVEVLPVPNHVFGETVTVAGLLTVEDIAAALQNIAPADVLVLPGEIFRGPEEQSLDGKKPADLATFSRGHVYITTEQEGKVLQNVA